MKWVKNDLSKYVTAKEYVDTAIIPLQNFQLSDDAELEKDAFKAETLGIYLNELEKEISGRVILTPPYTYLKTSNYEVEIDRLHHWIAEISKQPFQHIFLVTFDTEWKKLEKSLEANLIWLPSVNVVDANSQEAIKFIRSQVEQISDLIRSYW